MSGTSLSPLRESRVKDDDKGNGVSLNGLDPTFVPMKGLLSRELSRIGANGVMVLRMGSALGRDAGHCRLQRRTREKKVGTFVTHWEQLLFTLRRSRGAIGSYQGPSGAPSAAPDVPRRPTDGSDGFPGSGKGLSCTPSPTHCACITVIYTLQHATH